MNTLRRPPRLRPARRRRLSREARAVLPARGGPTPNVHNLESVRSPASKRLSVPNRRSWRWISPS